MSVKAIVAMMCGTCLLRLVWSGQHDLYVQGRMQIPLIVSAVVLLFLAAFDVLGWPPKFKRANSHNVQADESDGNDHDHDHGHGHDHGTGIAWLLLLPVLAIVVVAPPALSISAPTASNFQPTGLNYSPLPTQPEPVSLALSEYVGRASEPSAPTLKGRTIELVGFGVPAKSGEGFILVRFSIACCAADGIASQIRVLGTLPKLPGNSADTQVWLKIVGVHKKSDGDTPVFEPTSVTNILPPDEPYE
jgi:uncharacterized repeat protein (TIGR03943 family)